MSAVGFYPQRCANCGVRFTRFEPDSLGMAWDDLFRSRRWRGKRLELALYGSGVLLFICFLYYMTRYGR